MTPILHHQLKQNLWQEEGAAAAAARQEEDTMLQEGGFDCNMEVERTKRRGLTLMSVPFYIQLKKEVPRKKMLMELKPIKPITIKEMIEAWEKMQCYEDCIHQTFEDFKISQIKNLKKLINEQTI